MAEFTWLPDHKPKRSIVPRILKAQFGDGYTQRTRSGLNTMLETWTMNFTLKTRAKVREIEDFLESHAGVDSFTWVTPRGESLSFVCEKWESDYGHDQDCSISCTFEQEP